MTISKCIPFGWAVSIRSFGKKVRDTVTSLGYIQWPEDEQIILTSHLDPR